MWEASSLVTWTGSTLLLRFIALSLALVALPVLLSISALRQPPVREGEPSPRTVITPETVRIDDPEATERARRLAADRVAPTIESDAEARSAIVQRVRDLFDAVAGVREAGETERRPSAAEQISALEGQLPMLDEDGLRQLVRLSDSQLSQVGSEAVAVAQQLARQPIREDNLETVATQDLPDELALRSFPNGAAEQIVDPIIRSALRPTVRVNQEVTEENRAAAAEQVEPVRRTFPAGTAIVTAGQIVDSIQLAALRERGLAGAEPWRALLTAFALCAILVLTIAAYLRTHRAHIWRSTRRLVLLASLLVLYSAVLQGVVLLAPSENPAWLFLIPAGSIAMLATILFDPPVGVLVAIPIAALTSYSIQGQPGITAFVALAALLSVPLVSRLSARGDLRRAAWRSTVGYVALAAAFAVIFHQPSALPLALLAGLLNGVLTAVIVNGSLPFLESTFGILTATSLLDLADRNHPLLRELEQKALGSYNHSIMVSTMVERGCRAIGADGLLGSVAALYHDIGKVRRPYFFVENQFGIPNPHDELEPRVSAIIIQEHVTDGIEMSKAYRLPPEVVEGIATHHGTTLVSYFYAQAKQSAADPSEVDEEHFRYKGRKPSSKEMAVLMLADCCEGASRAAALENRNLSNADLEGIVTRMFADRVEDGQLDESALTFHELRMVERSFIETLIGVYHPRITYPKPDEAPISGALPSGGDGDRSPTSEARKSGSPETGSAARTPR
ncbi:MAG TPA: HDIG domain-containing protein [Egibacteraceae bacterium]|nr:HDIG domain-containing protein [Egibacteraceae bacterium]